MRIALVSILFVFSSQAFAGDLEWSGLYRIEGQSIQNPALTSGSSKNKDYGVHHLIMRPKIVAADGLYIQGQFHIMNGNSFGGPQLGSVWGNGLSYNSANQENQDEESFAVSEFYVSMAQEFGSLLAGRAPLQFGLGMTYDAGKDLFDHYYTNRDLVGYKIVMGNFFFMPMYAKVDESPDRTAGGGSGIAGSTDINEIILHFQYDNPEENVAMGVMYNNRTAGVAGNTTAVDDGSAFYGGGTGTVNSDLNIKNLSIYYEKSWEESRLGFEVLNQTGDYGVTVNGESVEANAIALALEYDSTPQEKRWHWGVRAGWASGDDPSTNDEYEGVQFNQNYDVGVLMFNHALGQANLMRSEMKGTRYDSKRNGGSNLDSTSDDPDIEAIGNAYYFSPQFTYKWRDKWDVNLNLVTGWLDQADFGLQTADKGLGYEVDVSLVFRPNERLVWENTVAAFMPGTAWEVDGNNFGTSTAYGFVSRAAISF